MTDDQPLDPYDRIATLGRMLWWATQLVLFIAWLVVWTRWLGGVGFVLGILFSPTVMFFPVAYWIASGAFPVWHLVLWGVGLAGLFVNAWAQQHIVKPPE